MKKKKNFLDVCLKLREENSSGKFSRILIKKRKKMFVALGNEIFRKKKKKKNYQIKNQILIGCEKKL